MNRLGINELAVARSIFSYVANVINESFTDEYEEPKTEKEILKDICKCLVSLKKIVKNYRLEEHARDREYERDCFLTSLYDEEEY